MSYKYILEPTSKKHVCPSCNKKRFVRYININAKEYLPEMYGRCDREANCSYHINPYTTGFEGEKTNVFSKLRTPLIAPSNCFLLSSNFIFVIKFILPENLQFETVY